MHLLTTLIFSDRLSATIVLVIIAVTITMTLCVSALLNLSPLALGGRRQLGKTNVRIEDGLFCAAH